MLPVLKHLSSDYLDKARKCYLTHFSNLKKQYREMESMQEACNEIQIWIEVICFKV